MSSPPPLTALLEHQQRLHIECQRCRHKREFPAGLAVETFGAAMTIPRLARILKCAACGARGRDKEITVYPDTNDYYASMERQRYAKDVAELGQEAADLTRSYRLRNSGELGLQREK